MILISSMPTIAHTRPARHGEVGGMSGSTSQQAPQPIKYQGAGRAGGKPGMLTDKGLLYEK